jgi:pimeloyl-ACP methyl ester carboxylesterase
MGHFSMEPVEALLYGLNKYVISRNNTMYYYWIGHGDSKTTLKRLSNRNILFSALANDILEVLDFLEIKKSHLLGFH